MTEPMTPEEGWRVAVDNLRAGAAMVKLKLDEGVSPIEVAGRLAVGYHNSREASAAAPGLLAVALVLLTTAEVL